jgi:hypothetical protein
MLKRIISTGILFLFFLVLSAQEYGTGELPETQDQYEYAPETDNYFESEPAGISVDEQWLKKRSEKLSYDEKEEPESEEDKSEETEETQPEEDKAHKPVSSGRSIWSGDTGKTLAYTLAFLLLAALLVFFIFKLGKKPLGENIAASPVAQSGIPDKGEDLRNWQPEEPLDLAIRNGQYRLALRILYLANLKLLIEKGILRPGLQKTNGDYVRELKDQGLKEDLRKLTAHFEYYWYGELPVTRAEFSTYREQSDTFYNQVRLSR